MGEAKVVQMPSEPAAEAQETQAQPQKPVAPIQQWADLIARELTIRLAPKGFKKVRNGKTIANLDYLTLDRLENVGEAMVRIMNYHLDMILRYIQHDLDEATKAEQEVKLELAACRWYDFKKKKRLKAELHEASICNGALKKCFNIVISVVPQFEEPKAK